MKGQRTSLRTVPRRFFVGILLVVAIPFLNPLHANPSGATVRHGNIQIQANGNTLQIIQGSSHGIIDWNSFSIQQGETTRFLQPGATAATLNRVTGQSLSTINGSLLANGRVLLVNPNGVLVGRSGVVDTGGFTASTLDLSNANFLAGGDLLFQGESTASVVNLGSINAVEGDVFLVAASVLNQGTLSARNGTVGLAAGNEVLIAESGSERVFVRGSGAVSQEDGVINRGTVNANVAELKAHGGNIYGMAVKNEGRVAATAVSREGGQIFLRARGGSRVQSGGTLVAKQEASGGTVVVESGANGSTEVSGTVDVRADQGEGGMVIILGSTVNLFEGSLILADGETNGGRIFVGGGRRGLDPGFMNATDLTVASGAELSANGGSVGNGGEVIVFADNRLNFSGRVSAIGGSVSGDGGFVELSGKKEVIIPDLASRVNLSAAGGRAGTLLFDPIDISIVSGTGEGIGSPASANTLYDADIVSFLNTANLVIETAEGEGFGDITMAGEANITWNSASNLLINAARDFIQLSGAVIKAEGSGGIEIEALGSASFHGEVATASGDILVDAGDDISMAGGSFQSDSGGIELSAGRSITVTGSTTIIKTIDGNIDLMANSGVDPRRTGDFTGVLIDQGAAVESADGNIQLEGVGGTDTNGNRGVWLRNGAGLEAGGLIKITGTSALSDGVAVAIDAEVESTGGSIEIRSEGGDVTVSRPLTADGNITFFAAPGMDTEFRFNTATPLERLGFVGGLGTGDKVDFSGSPVAGLGLSADQFDRIEYLVGNSDAGSEFFGAEDSAAIFSFSGIDEFDYSDEGGNRIHVAGFNNLTGGGLGDAFHLDYGSGTFAGTIRGGEGDDLFKVLGSGSSASLSGGGGYDTLDFSEASLFFVSVNLESASASGVNAFDGIDSFIGGVGDFDALYTTSGRDTITIAHESGGQVEYTEGESSRTVDFSGFSYIDAGDADDDFVIDVARDGAGNEIEGPPSFLFQGTLSGGAGRNRFQFESGMVGEISGGFERNGILDFTHVSSDLTVDLSGFSALTTPATAFPGRSGVSYFAEIGEIIGGGGANVLSGTAGMDQVVINGNGIGAITFGEEISTYFLSSLDGGGYQPSFTTIGFEGFSRVNAGLGDDVFRIELPAGVDFTGLLEGDGGADQFILAPGGGSVAAIEGGAGVDTLDFSRFTTPVAVDLGSRTASRIQAFTGIESVIGGSGQDTLAGTAGADQFRIERNNGGFLNSGAFDSFEILQGQGGADRFVFANQAVVSSFSGGAGIDTFVLDDSNLTGNQTYEVRGNTVSRNPFYQFSQIEFLQFFLGSGNDTVITDSNGLIQVLNGGAGFDTINFGTTPVTGRTPFLFGGTQLFESGFENFLFVRNEADNPENINIQGPANPDTLGNGNLIDQFTTSGGLDPALGNAFSAMAGNALITGQAAMIQVDGNQYQLQAPASLDGFFTQPPHAIIEQLTRNLEVNSWAELADALDFDGATILVNGDGPYSISLDGVPPDQILAVLQESLLADPARELIDALELALVVPITSLDGAVSILTIPIQIDPATLAVLLGNLDDAAFSELTAALGD